MNDKEQQKIVNKYLQQLARELDDVPADTRRELLEDIRGHIDEAWTAAETHDRQTLQAILDRLGSPEALAAEERERLGLPKPTSMGPGALEVAAVLLTALVWPIGLLLAWLSDRWTTRDKVIATLIPVIGLAMLFTVSFAAFATFTTTTGPREVITSTTNAITGEVQEEHQVTPASSTGGSNTFLSVLAQAIALYGLFGAPLTSAIFLALRIRRGSRLTVMVPVIATVLVLSLLIVVLLSLFAFSTPGPAGGVQGPSRVSTQEVQTP
jgi:uncharacterized membrane protein